MRPIHPGEILREEYTKPLGLSANALAQDLGITAARVNDILRERRGITADTALRLARYFDTDALSWLNLQTAFELRTAEITSGKSIAKQVRKRAA
ncbi:MAG: HigA family addiction module antitoxin [Rhodospirillales bacterium]|jgi:addiction module HigA family antidote